MSDILVYSALTEKQRLEQVKEDLTSTAISLEDAQITQEGTTGPNYLGSATPFYTYTAPDTSNRAASLGAQWCTVFGDLAAAKDNGIKVCDTNNYKRCGADCTFTVPAGVERITYQMWGAGTGSQSICCCGGSPYGTNGSFAIGEFDVVAGDIICMRAACAYCCYADYTTPGQAVSATCIRHVSGSDCFTICAPSGPDPHICRWHCALTNQGLVPHACQRWQPDVEDTGCAITFCSGCWSFCWDTGADEGFTPMVYDHVCKPNFNNQANFDAKNTTLYGIPAMWGEMSVGDNWCNDPNSYLLNAPVFGFPSINCKADMNISSCCPGCCFRACTGIQQAPAIGGFPSRIISGGGACYGDAGGMGMICLSYNCI